MFNERVYQFPSFFPSASEETHNRIICVNRTPEKPFVCLMTNRIVDLVVTGGFGSPSQCFPFYTYDADGSNRRENITGWALDQFRAAYGNAVSKWDIFHYVYALLHHPTYRETYAANLRRELPRIPFVRDFWPFVEAGRRLAHIHVHYEDQPEYPLRHEENPDLPLDYRVEKMRLSRDRTSLKYNDFLTLRGIPPEVYDYRLGNRSALEWVIDQYRVKTDSRSGITNDPNNPDDETYILRLVKQVITVSLETVEIVNALPALDILDHVPA
jgi:predicted helicase